MDNINYKIFKCYRLLSEFDNLKHNYAFYVIAGVFLVLLFFDLMYFIYTIPKIKNMMLKEAPTPERVRIETIRELIKIRKTSENNLINPPKRKKSGKGVNKEFKKKFLKKKDLKQQLQKNL